MTLRHYVRKIAQKGKILSLMSDRGEVVLRKNEERRLLAGHKWVFSNEVQRLEGGGDSPFLVDVRSSSGRFLGTGIYNAHSLIAVRLLEGRVGSFSDYLVDRIGASLRMREVLGGEGPDSALRLVHSEADALPGLVVDRYGDYLSVQITTRTMEAFSETLLGILSSSLSPRGIRVDRTLRARETEGLPAGEDLYVGEVPPEASVLVGGVPLKFPFREGQKTGLFLDQADNVGRLVPFLGRGRVLDAFCYVGGWSSALVRQEGVRQVTGVDSSERAMDFYRENTRGAGKDVVPVCGDFLKWGRQAADDGRRYDAVILDPPAFIKNRRLMKEGIEGYYSVFRLGASLLEKEGVLVACSCSALLEWEDFSGILRSVFRKERKKASLFYQGRASWDHPRLLSMPELDYLKCAAFWVEDL
jgi:23S rRNA (cytosine1962-C5)-methyltransferase